MVDALKLRAACDIIVITCDDYYAPLEQCPTFDLAALPWPGDGAPPTAFLARGNADMNSPNSVRWSKVLAHVHRVQLEVEEELARVVAEKERNNRRSAPMPKPTVILVEGLLLLGDCPGAADVRSEIDHFVVAEARPDPASQRELWLRKYKRTHLGKPSYEQRGVSEEAYQIYWVRSVLHVVPFPNICSDQRTFLLCVLFFCRKMVARTPMSSLAGRSTGPAACPRSAPAPSASTATPPRTTTSRSCSPPAGSPTKSLAEERVTSARTAVGAPAARCTTTEAVAVAVVVVLAGRVIVAIEAPTSLPLACRSAQTESLCLSKKPACPPCSPFQLPSPWRVLRACSLLLIARAYSPCWLGATGF